MAVYDCFPFLNENDILELRINQHWDFVDKFIIIDGMIESVGEIHHLLFEASQNIDRF